MIHRYCVLLLVAATPEPGVVVPAMEAATAAECPTYPRVHRVAGGPSEVFANAYIIEGRFGVVVVDTLLTRSGTQRLRLSVDAIGKPLLGILLTHGHPDHYGGVTGLVEGRPEIPVIAVKGVDRVIRRDDAAKGRALQALGIDWATTRTFPNVAVDGGVRLVLGDIEMTVLDLGMGESDHDSVWILRGDGGARAFVGDQIMSGVHAYTADGHSGSWLKSLRRLDSRLRGAVHLYPGHGDPGGGDLIEQQIAYLERFRAEVRDVSEGRRTLSDGQLEELERRMVGFLGHAKMSRWIYEGAAPVARELTQHAEH